jgi:hypothetical protein
MATYSENTTDSSVLSDAAQATRILTVSASDSASSSDQCLPQNPTHDSATFHDVASVVTDLGRFRRGDWVPLGFHLNQLPDYVPVVVILDANNTQVASAMMPSLTPDGLTYFLPYQVGLALSVGNFSVFYHYVISGQSTLQLATFEVVPGGDSGGAVISMYSVDRPEVRSLVAQLDSGVLVLGRSPLVQG